MKEGGKKDKYPDHARELKKKLCNKKITIIPIVFGILATVTNSFVKRLEDLEIRGQVVTIQTTAFLRSARRVQDTCGDLSPRPQ